MKNWMTYLILLAVGIAIGSLFPRGSRDQVATYAVYSGGQLTSAEVISLKGLTILDSEKSLYYMKKNAVDEILRKRFLGAEGDYLQTDDIQFKSEEFEEYLVSTGYNPKKNSKQDYENLYNNFRLKIAKNRQNQKYFESASQMKLQYTFPLPNFPEVDLKSKAKASLGNKSASLSISFFLNYMSPHLKASLAKMESLNQAFPNKLKFDIRFKGADPEDSLSFSSFEAALCANEQKSFSEIHQLLLKTQINDPKQLKDLLLEMKLEKGKIEECLKKRPFKRVVLQDQKELEDFQNYAEPVFVIKNKLVSSLEDFEILKDLIQREL